jgi:hypothetical protein
VRGGVGGDGDDYTWTYPNAPPYAGYASTPARAARGSCTSLWLRASSSSTRGDVRARAAMDERREALYLTLGVSPGASVSTLKRAYRRAAKRCHPDVCADADAIERFLDVQNAYEELLAESGSLQTVGQTEWRDKWRKQVQRPCSPPPTVSVRHCLVAERWMSLLCRTFRFAGR